MDGEEGEVLMEGELMEGEDVGARVEELMEERGYEYDDEGQMVDADGNIVDEEELELE